MSDINVSQIVDVMTATGQFTAPAGEITVDEWRLNWTNPEDGSDHAAPLYDRYAFRVPTELGYALIPSEAVTGIVVVELPDRDEVGPSPPIHVPPATS